MKIGFIGLGIMGSRMAANLQKHGHDLVVFNRTRAKAQPLLDNGATFAEAMALGEGLGLTSKMLFDSLLGTPVVAPFLAATREKIESANYEAEFPLRWMQKDMHLATVSAYETGVALPLTNVTKEMYRLAMRDGHDTEDFSAIYEFTTANNGKERKSNSIGDRGQSSKTTRRKVA